MKNVKKMVQVGVTCTYYCKQMPLIPFTLVYQVYECFCTTEGGACRADVTIRAALLVKMDYVYSHQFFLTKHVINNIRSTQPTNLTTIECIRKKT